MNSGSNVNSGSDLNSDVVKQNNARQVDTLKNIQKLQDLEKELYKNLEKNAANGATADKQQATIAKINELSQIRLTMFEELDAMYKGVQGRVAQSRVDLVDQMMVTGIVEKELNDAKQRLNNMNTDKHNKMRMVEINTYYSQKYRAQASLMKAIIFISLVFLILIIVAKKDWIPENIINGIIGVWVVICAIYIIYRIVDISRRSNMNFDEYDWEWNANANKPTVIQYDEENILGSITSLKDDANNFAASIGIGCVGTKCCSTGTKYDIVKNQCVEAFCSSKEKKSIVVPFSNTDNYVRF